MGQPTQFQNISFGFGDGLRDNVGGSTVAMLAGLALNLGEVVFISGTAETVSKSVTATEYAKYVGVVVGGNLTGMHAISHNPPATGTIACAAINQPVLIQISGIAWFLADAIIASGNELVPSTTTAGRVIAGTTAGQRLGTVIAGPSAVGNLVRGFIYRR